MLGEIELAEDFETRHNARHLVGRKHGLLLDDAVDAEPDMHEALVGDEVNVARAGDRRPAENLVDSSHRRRVGCELAFEAQLLVDERSAAAKLMEKHRDVVCRSNSQRDGIAACELK